MTPDNDFLDNLANDQHQKMLREIANDDITPRKTNKKVQNDLYEADFDEDGLDYEDDIVGAVPLAEY